ncbi:para-aminobenzoate synthetase component 2 [Bisgaardia hudsonensis]|uniref:Para-aminobenzoate synthetase component 2 n=1 Tax=Bisgaardia hudsonensis TaxID=109472 RepID=A0A4R2N256_9PAST|nr:anthranilate synthase component II [Bisgaardia hudsonensis]QLB12364.1 anthranilate synthase component 2 [Bisgaardia hudsonensis]TCP13889.1 para-aminobenzoate synthetase component 2 [Bisgaardia hudsonensis]
MNLLIVNNHDSFTYNLVELVRKLKCPFEVIDVECVDLSLINHFTHILISPGPDVPSAYPQLFSLVEKYYLSKSILGVCLGHQMLCQFFGAVLYNLPKVRHGQSHNIFIKSDSILFQNLLNPFRIGLYHSWAVSKDDFPIDLNIIAECDENIIMAFEHKYLPIYGIQFHPESYISENGLKILKNWLSNS